MTLSIGGLTAVPAPAGVSLALSSRLTGGAGGYAIAVHRGTSANFTPSTATLLSSNAKFPFTDYSAPVGIECFYGALGSDSAGAQVWAAAPEFGVTGIATPMFVPAMVPPVGAAVVFFGDSITAGYGTSGAGTMLLPSPTAFALAKVAALNPARRFVGINQGVPGTTLSDWNPAGGPGGAFAVLLANGISAAATLFAQNPGAQQVFSIMLGTNDSASGGNNNSPAGTISVANYQAKLTGIIAALLAAWPLAKVIAHYPPWYSPNTALGSAVFAQAGLDALIGYMAPLRAAVAGFPASQVRLGDTTNFAVTAAGYASLLQGETGVHGTLFLHPKGTVGTDGRIGTQVVGEAWGAAISQALYGNGVRGKYSLPNTAIAPLSPPPPTSVVLAGFPTAGVAGAALNLAGATAALSPIGTTGYATLHNGTAEVGSRVAFGGFVPPAVSVPAAAGTFTYKVFAGSAGGAALSTSPAITVAAGGSAPTLAVTGVSPLAAGGTSTATLAFSNGAPSSISATMDGAALAVTAGNVQTLAGSGPTASGVASFAFAAPAAGSHTLVASGAGTYAATSASFALATETGVAFAVTSVAPQAIGLAGAFMAFVITYTGTLGTPAVTVDGDASTPVGVTKTGTGTATFKVVAPQPGANYALHALTAAGTSGGAVSVLFAANPTLVAPSNIYCSGALPATQPSHPLLVSNPGFYTGAPPAGGSGTWYFSDPADGRVELPIGAIISGWSQSNVAPPGPLGVIPAGGTNTPGIALTTAFQSSNYRNWNTTGRFETAGTYYLWVITSEGYAYVSPTTCVVS